MFLRPGDAVYEGMIIGEHNRDNDIDVTKTFVASRYKATVPTLHNWITKNKIDTKAIIDRRP